MADPKVELNPVTVGYIDTGPTVSQRVPVTAATPLPVTDAGEATAVPPASDPGSVLPLSNQAILRGLLVQVIDGNAKMQERLDLLLTELRAHSLMFGEAFEYAGGPESAPA